MANCQEICSTDPSKSRNNDSGKGKSVTVLLPSDVTVRKKTHEVLMPNTIEMAQIKKTGKERFKTGIHFSSKMSEKDVEKTLQDEFNILKNHRFCCASAADNRTKLNFHGEQRVWDGRFIKRNITGNSALYILIQLEETNTSGLTRESGESHQQPIPGPSNQKIIPPGAASVVSRPFNLDLVPNPTSHLKWASEKRNIDSEIAQQESSSQQSHPGLAKRKNRNRLNVVLEQKSQKKSSSTTVTPHSGGTDLQQTENQVLMYQTLGDNTTKSGILLGTAVGNSSQQVQHCDKAVAGNIGMQVFSQASQQSSNPMEVMVMTPIALQSDLSMSTSTMVQGSPPQHWPIAREYSVEHVATDPREPVPLGKEQRDRTVPNVYSEALKSLSHCSKHDQRSVAQASLKPVSTTSISQQRELTAQTSEHGSPLQQAPPASAAAAAHKKVHTASTKKPSVSERQREIFPHERQEFPLLCSASDGETSDSAFNSMLENESNHDTVQSRDTCIVHKITPCKGSTKGGDDFDIILRDILPLEIDSCVACFQNCGTVDLDQTVNPFTLSGRTPKSLQGPGPVNVTLMSSDGSWQGGEAVFEYIDDPPTFEEFLSKVVTDRDMRRELFNRMDKEMSSIKPSDGQTTDSCGKTASGSSSLSHSKCAWSVELLRLLVYKAAEIGGGEFIQMIFSTSARKVVFNSYKNSATLPEDVARSNGHLTLAYYLQDVNSRLSKESNSDAGTEGIDWLELKHAVDEEQSLTSGTNEAQILRKCPENDDDDDDDERDYFADDETSPSSSPCHSKVFDSENEAQNQNSKGTDHAEQDRLMAGSPSLEEARMCKSDPDLRIKSEQSEASGHTSFSEVSNWLQCCMQLGDTRHQTHARDPFLCARDLFCFQEQMDNLESRLPVLQAMALIKPETPFELNEMLISQTQNVCQLGTRREMTESVNQCKVFMPSFWDVQLMNEPRNGLCKNENVRGLFRDVDPKKEEADMAQMLERDSDRPASFSRVDSSPDHAWPTRDTPASRTGGISAFKTTEQRTFVMRKNHKTTFKSGRPRLCQFLLELLDNPDKFAYMIDWLDKDKGIFKFINSDEVVRLWGRRRNNPSMKYEKFVRSLRTYVAKGILLKRRGKLVYQFAKVKNLEILARTIRRENDANSKATQIPTRTVASKPQK